MTDLKLVKVKLAWKVVKAFEEGHNFYTKEGENQYTLITTVPKLVRYLYRLYAEPHTKRIVEEPTPLQYI